MINSISIRTGLSVLLLLAFENSRVCIHTNAEVIAVTTAIPKDICSGRRELGTGRRESFDRTKRLIRNPRVNRSLRIKLYRASACAYDRSHSGSEPATSERDSNSHNDWLVMLALVAWSPCGWLRSPVSYQTLFSDCLELWGMQNSQSDADAAETEKKQITDRNYHLEFAAMPEPRYQPAYLCHLRLRDSGAALYRPTTAQEPKHSFD